MQDNFHLAGQAYLKRLSNVFNTRVLNGVEQLTKDLREVWIAKKKVLICGNGGSAANAIHIANDLHYGVGACGTGDKKIGIRVEAITANQGIVTCLANDTGYDNVFASQIDVKGDSGDLLIVLSGSGNSPNVVLALRKARELGMKSYALVAYDGGKCLEEADQCIHFIVDDMQIAEDAQLVAGHLCMQWLNQNKPIEVRDIG